MNILKRAITWLLTKQSEVKKSMTTKLAITILVNSQPADGVSQNKVQITATDDAGTPVPDTVVNLSVTNGTIQASGATDSSGTLTVPVTSSNVGMSIITASAVDSVAQDSTLYFVAVQPAVVNQTAIVETQPSALAVLKASFEKKLQFIEGGIATLGADAEKELVDLAEKYL